MAAIICPGLRLIIKLPDFTLCFWLFKSYLQQVTYHLFTSSAEESTSKEVDKHPVLCRVKAARWGWGYMFICCCDRIPLFINYPVGPLIMSYWTLCWRAPPHGRTISCCTASVSPSDPRRCSRSLSSSNRWSVERLRKVISTILNEKF